LFKPTVMFFGLTNFSATFHSENRGREGA